MLFRSFVSGVNSCRFCYGAHSRVARAFGVDEAVLITALDDLEHASVDVRLKPILRYVRKLTETPTRMTDADAIPVYEAGWNDEALFHAIAVCAYFNNMNRLVEGAGIVGTPEEYDVAARRLVDHGYIGGTGRDKSRSRRRSKSGPPQRNTKLRGKPRQ